MVTEAQPEQDWAMMTAALEQARASLAAGGVPVGAIGAAMIGDAR